MVPDGEVVINTKAMLHQARVTLVEVALYGAIKMSNADAKQAKKDVNDQVESFGRAQIVPATDLHRCIWQNSNKVVRDQPIL